MGRVALLLLLVALLATGCGRRPEPVGDATVVYPVGVRETYLDFPPKTAGGVGIMARTLNALEAPARGEKPDLIAAWASQPGSDAAQEAGSHGFVAPDRTIEQVEASIADLALLLGEPLRARPIVARIEASRRKVHERVRDLPPVRVFVDIGFFSTAGTRTLIGDLVSEAGGINVAGATPEPGPVDARQLALENPSVYVISSDSRTTIADLRSDARLRRLRAVVDNRVVVVPAQTIEPGPRVGEGLEAIARALHPDAFR